ncbi:MAG: hypothetical protein REI78_15080 [Pedobacter sp.]|nr:hypothetical protein [Pedobacter sp.]
MENFDHILLFRTDIGTEACKEKLKAILDSYAGIEQWSIDMDDLDCVLRIISYSITHQEIIDLINKHGYFCCELT